jgi:hypothetical protein
MNCAFRLNRVSLTKAAAVLGILVATFAAQVARAELMFEHADYHNGGTLRYYSDGNIHSAEFNLDQGIRVDAIGGWFQNYPMDVTAGIQEFDAEFGDRGSVQWHVPMIPNPPPPALTLPGHWVTKDVKWDLKPGHYELYFSNAWMSVSYDDASGVGGFAAYNNSYLDEDGRLTRGGTQGFGVRLYGTPLSAVPEPAAYGAMGSLVLFGAVLLRRAGVSRRLRATS